MRHHGVIVRTPAPDKTVAPISGYGHNGMIYTNTQRDFDAEFESGTLTDANVISKVRSTIRSNLPYKNRKTQLVELDGGFKTFLAGGKYKRLGNLIKFMVIESSKDRLVREVSRSIVHAYRVPSKDWVNEAAAIQHFIIRFIRYDFDTGEQFTWPGRALVDWYNEREGLDCDCMSILGASLLRSLGYKDIAVVLVDSRFDGVLNHACAAVKMPTPKTAWGVQWINMEFTRGYITTSTPFGWKPQPMYTKYKMFIIPLEQG